MIVEVAEVIQCSHNIRKQLNAICFGVEQLASVGEIFECVEAFHQFEMYAYVSSDVLLFLEIIQVFDSAKLKVL